jgi:putative flippase GtrA
MNNEVVRYIVNGIIATLVHYNVLTLNIKIIELESAGVSNFIAAIFGISASFIGSRYFVFKSHQNSLSNQLILFSALYASIAVMHGLTLYWWSDIQHMDYRIGFVLATGLQVMLSYWGNKKLVFKSV